MKRNCARWPNTTQSRVLGAPPWKKLLDPSQAESAARSWLASCQMVAVSCLLTPDIKFLSRVVYGWNMPQYLMAFSDPKYSPSLRVCRNS